MAEARTLTLRVDGRRSLLTLLPADETLVARDTYHRIWVKEKDGQWRCYGSLVHRQGVEVAG